MSHAAWSFVDYTCGHSAPVRGGDRVIDRVCPNCTCWDCGCIYTILDQRNIQRCDLHTIGRFACCEQATRLACVCYEAFSCPTHGSKHVGTHD